MRDFYEELWEALPAELQPPELRARRRLLEAELRSGDRVLDLGCGAGAFSVIAAEAGAGAVTAADVAQAALDRARETVAASGSSGGAEINLVRVPFDGPLPFADASFELVWASEVIEHVADTAASMRELRRVLAPGGRLLITTPAHGRLRLLVGGIERYSHPQGDHLHLYTRGALRELLSGFGFTAVSVGFLTGPVLYRRTLYAVARM